MDVTSRPLGGLGRSFVARFPESVDNLDRQPPFLQRSWNKGTALSISSAANREQITCQGLFKIDMANSMGRLSKIDCMKRIGSSIELKPNSFCAKSDQFSSAQRLMRKTQLLICL
jgi:hypothetical protein